MSVNFDDEECSSFEDCRDFAQSGGVAQCVLRRVDDKSKYSFMSINGIDAKTVRLMKTWSKIPPKEDLVEIMCCPGGCLAGPGTLVTPQAAIKAREGYRKQREEARKKNAENNA